MLRPVPPRGRGPGRLRPPLLSSISWFLFATAVLLSDPEKHNEKVLKAACVSCLPCSGSSFCGPAPRNLGRKRRFSEARFRAARRAAGSAGDAAAAGREALKRCLAREYRSFFRPFEAEFYSEDVTFKDPLNNLEGKDKYRSNVAMLSGESTIGNILFRDGYIDLHSVEDVPDEDRRLRTRWTLGFTFKLLPWQPKALFTGVSEYTITADAKVLSQRDYWDTINLGSDGTYAPEAAFAGLTDLGEQFLPPFLRSSAEHPALDAGAWVLLRRGGGYRIYRAGAGGDGTVFALPALGTSLTSEGLAGILRGSGLSLGGQCTVDVETGEFIPEGSNGGQLGIKLLPPHPWDGEPPTG